MEKSTHVKLDGPGEYQVYFGTSPKVDRTVGFKIEQCLPGGVLEFIKNKFEQFTAENIHVTFSCPEVVDLSEKNYGKITLVLEEVSEDNKIVIADVFALSSVPKNLLINNDSSKMSPAELSKFLKQNRNIFINASVNHEIVAKLRNFDATVSKKMSEASDDRANKFQEFRQEVISTIPESFEVLVPIFEGQPKYKFNVEIHLEALGNQVLCSLYSIDLVDIISQEAARLVNDEVSRIKEYFAEKNACIPVIKVY